MRSFTPIAIVLSLASVPAAAQDVVVMRQSLGYRSTAQRVEWKATAGSCASAGIRNQDVQCVKSGTSTPATGCSGSAKPASTVSDATCTAITCGGFIQGYWSTDLYKDGSFNERGVSGLSNALAKCQAYARSIGKSGVCATVGSTTNMSVNYYPDTGRQALSGRTDVYAAICQ